MATPDGGKCQDTEQIIDAALQALDLIGCLFHLHFHGQIAAGPYVCCVARRSRSSRKNSSGGTKKGFSWRMPPMMIIGWVRIILTTISPPNLARSYIHMTGSLYRGNR